MHMKDTPSPVWACCWAAHPWLPGSSCPPALWAWTWWWDDPSSTFSHNPPLGKATERIGWNDTHRHTERNYTWSCGCYLHIFLINQLAVDEKQRRDAEMCYVNEKGWQGWMRDGMRGERTEAIWWDLDCYKQTRTHDRICKKNQTGWF